MGKNDMIEFEVTFVRETAAAILVELDGEEYWLPKSQIQWIGAAEEGDILEVNVPRWLVETKEMR